jgi:large subunit ribosomal protein L30
MQAKRLRITQVRGTVSRPRAQRRVLAGLGLGRPGKSVVREDTPAIRGMVFKIQHLVQVETVEGAE